MHADQTHGINDLRVFYINKKTIPVYADNATSKYLLKNFSYCFNKTYNEYPPILNLINVKKKFYIYDDKRKILINSVKVKHGKVNSICYIIDRKLAYISDVSKIKKRIIIFFFNLKYLVIDCLWYRKHPSHLNFDQSLELIKFFKPKKQFLLIFIQNLIIIL